MFPSGYFSIPYSVTGVGISDPATAPLVGDQSQIVGSDRTRLKRLRPGNNVTLSSTDDAITISSLGGGDGTSVLTLNNPATTPLDGDVSLRYDSQSVKRLRPGSSRITCVDQSDCVVIDTPVLAYTKAESDAKYRTTADSYSQTQVYTKTQCDNTFLTTQKVLVAGGDEAANGHSLVESDHVLRRLKGGTNVTITPSANQLLIDASGGPVVDAYTKTEVYTKTESDNTFLKTQKVLVAGGTEAANGHSLVESDHVLRRLKGGTNITITPSENQILIDASSGTNTWNNAGTGLQVVKGPYDFRTMNGVSPITLVYDSSMDMLSFGLDVVNLTRTLMANQTPGRTAPLPLLNFDFSYRDAVHRILWQGFPSGTSGAYIGAHVYMLCAAYPFKSNNTYWYFPDGTGQQFCIAASSDASGSKPYMQISRTCYYICTVNNRPRLNDWVVLVMNFQTLPAAESVVFEKRGGTDQRTIQLIAPATNTEYFSMQSLLNPTGTPSVYGRKVLTNGPTRQYTDTWTFVLCFQYTTTSMNIKFGKRAIISVNYAALDTGTAQTENQFAQTTDLTGHFYFGPSGNANTAYQRFYACRFYDKEWNLTNANIDAIANETHEEFGCTMFAS